MGLRGLYLTLVDICSILFLFNPPFRKMNTSELSPGYSVKIQPFGPLSSEVQVRESRNGTQESEAPHVIEIPGSKTQTLKTMGQWDPLLSNPVAPTAIRRCKSLCSLRSLSIL